MKKYLLLIFTIIFIAACNKTEIEDNETQSVTKDYLYEKDLMAGQYTKVGTVTYLDTENGYLKIVFDLTDGWYMTESHAFAGHYEDLPRVKKGSPKIGHFPYSADHGSGVTSYSYTHQIDGWTPYPDFSWHTDFVCAAHAVVNHPNFPEETAWAAGDKNFSNNNSDWSTYSSDWGNYTDHLNVIFGIQQNTDGSLGLVYINTSAPAPEIILTETVNTSGGEVIAAAFDPNENLLFFVIGNTLYVNDMNSEDPSVAIGSSLPGTPVGGAFINGNFYYLDADPSSSNYNEIIEVQLTYYETSGTWSMTINDNFSDPYTLTFGTTYQITDMASDGVDIYLVGIDPYGNVDLIVCNVDAASGTGTWNSSKTSTQLNGDTQLAFGPDGVLYAVDTDNVGDSQLVSIDLDTGDKDVIDNTIGNTVGDMSDLVTGR